MIKKSPFFFLTILIILSGLSGCRTQATPPAQTPTPEILQAPTTPSATLTPTPVPGKVVIIVPPGSETQAQVIQPTLQELTQAGGLILETRPALQITEIGPDWRIVVLLSPSAELPNALGAAPQTQFVVISATDLGQANNLNIVRMQPEKQAFMAGYLSTLIADDWRAAGLLGNAEPLAYTIQDAYTNGGNYYCGVCNPFLAPLVRFPIAARLDPAAGLVTWQTQVEELRKNVVYLFYVAPEVANPELLDWLAQQNFILIGGQTPPQEVRSHWAATIGYDLNTPLRQLWDGMIAGQGSRMAVAPLVISDTNPEFISAGRLALAQKTMQELWKGEVLPNTPPLQ